MLGKLCCFFFKTFFFLSWEVVLFLLDDFFGQIGIA